MSSAVTRRSRLIAPTLFVTLLSCRHAQPVSAPSALPLELTWRATDQSCPSQAEVSALIEQRPGVRALRRAQPLAVDAQVHRIAERWELLLRTRGPTTTGERRLETDSCSHLADAAALIVASALVEEEERAASAQVPLDPLHVFVRVAGEGQLGVLPASSGALLGVIGLKKSMLRLEAWGGRGLSQTLRAGSSPDSGARLEVSFMAGLRGCATLGLGKLEVAGCVGAVLGPVGGIAFGISDPRAGQTLWVSALGGGALGLRVWQGLSVRLDAEAGWNVRRARFTVDPFGTLYEMPPVMGRLGLGVELQLW